MSNGQSNVWTTERHIFSCICSVYVLLISLELLLFPNDGYLSVYELKYVFFKWTSIVFVVMVAIFHVEFWLIHKTKKRNADLSASSLCFLLYLLCTVLSGILSEYNGTLNGNIRHDGMLTIGLYVLCFLCLSAYFVPTRWMLLCFSIEICVICVLGLVQLTGKNPLSLFPAGLNYYDAGAYYASQFWSTIGNTDLCAAVLSIAIAVFASAFICRKRKADWMLVIPIVFTVVSLIEINVEMGLVALFGGLLLMGPVIVIDKERLCNYMIVIGLMTCSILIANCMQFYDGGICARHLNLWLLLITIVLLSSGLIIRRVEKFNPDKRTLRLGMSILTIAIISLGTGYLYFMDSLPDGFLSQIHAVLHGEWDDTFGSGRVYIWKQAMALIPESPFLGGGPDTLGLRGLSGFSRYSDQLDTMITSSIDVAHNEYLNIAVNQGLLALSAYLFGIFIILSKWWKNPQKTVSAIAGTVVLFYCIQASFGIASCCTTPFLWIALAAINNQKQGEDDDERNKKTDISQSRIASAVDNAANICPGGRSKRT